ncbi:MAG: hypothetical protein KC416_06740 [Myxococcales bacterium]|nr:hypothetical protein [Myxococcales bacterium]
MLGTLALTASAVPFAMAMESVLRRMFFPPEFEDLREALRPILFWFAWANVGVTALAIPIAGRTFTALQQRAKDRSVDSGGALLATFLTASSIPQVPSLFATFLFMLGAPLGPVAVSILTGTGAIAALARRWWLGLQSLSEGVRTG